jgi:hypothetical protein
MTNFSVIPSSGCTNENISIALLNKIRSRMMLTQKDAGYTSSKVIKSKISLGNLDAEATASSGSIMGLASVIGGVVALGTLGVAGYNAAEALSESSSMNGEIGLLGDPIEDDAGEAATPETDGDLDSDDSVPGGDEEGVLGLVADDSGEGLPGGAPSEETALARDSRVTAERRRLAESYDAAWAEEDAAALASPDGEDATTPAVSGDPDGAPTLETHGAIEDPDAPSPESAEDGAEVDLHGIRPANSLKREEWNRQERLIRDRHEKIIKDKQDAAGRKAGGAQMSNAMIAQGYGSWASKEEDARSKIMSTLLNSNQSMLESAGQASSSMDKLFEAGDNIISAECRAMTDSAAYNARA